jgi:hypothetical protein
MMLKEWYDYDYAHVMQEIEDNHNTLVLQPSPLPKFHPKI